MEDVQRDFTDWAAGMEAAEVQMGEILSARTNLSADAVASASAGDTWYTAGEALEAGLITTTGDEKKDAAEAMAALGRHSHDMMLGCLLENHLETRY